MPEEFGGSEELEEDLRRKERRNIEKNWGRKALSVSNPSYLDWSL